MPRRRRPAGEGGDDQDGAGTREPDDTDDTDDADETGADGEDSGGGRSGSSRRRRRRRREGDGGGGQNGGGQNGGGRGGGGGDDPQNTVTRVRKPRSAEDEITAVSGSTRLEAKKQRRREGREAGRRRAPIVSEAEFLARRESVDRTMVIRQRADLTQIAVLEDKVLVEHYVAREAQASMIGNVYLGRVQNVLPSMEAAFIDIGKGRNAVLYAGEVNWQALGHKDGAPRKIESVLSSGQPILVQVTKDPIGHKGSRLTSQVSLAGRFLVYVPDGTTNGISRKLADTERHRLKSLLKEIVPDSAGVIVRTAAEGASEDELTRDVERLRARWEDIERKVAKGNAPQLLYGEPDLTLKVVRDLFTEDFARLVVQGEEAWQTVSEYVEHVAPDLAERLEHHEADTDVFATYRIDEQIAKGLDRKVWLPSGGSLVIDRTEAMTVVDVNTGKFTGSGGNLEETVTKNNLEAAEEIVRQLRLRDLGGIIVVDFIDMVLESNRDLVLRRLVECLGRDRTRHQVAEVTSLGLVQMTRKRIGTGLVEAFSHTCEQCGGRGVVLHDQPVEPSRGGDDDGKRGRRGRSGRGGQDDDRSESGSGRDRGRGGRETQAAAPSRPPSPADVAAMARAAERPRRPRRPRRPTGSMMPRTGRRSSSRSSRLPPSSPSGRSCRPRPSSRSSRTRRSRRARCRRPPPPPRGRHPAGRHPCRAGGIGRGAGARSRGDPEPPAQREPARGHPRDRRRPGGDHGARAERRPGRCRAARRRAARRAAGGHPDADPAGRHPAGAGLSGPAPRPAFCRGGAGSVVWLLGAPGAPSLHGIPRPPPVVTGGTACPACRRPGREVNRRRRSAVYAIVRAGAIQQKVAVGDVISIDKVATPVGETLSLPVLLVVDGEAVTSAGLEGAAVTAEVLGATKGPKIVIQKYKNKTGYKKRQGHRQKYTQVKVTDISL